MSVIFLFFHAVGCLIKDFFSLVFRGVKRLASNNTKRIPDEVAKQFGEISEDEVIEFEEFLED